MVPINTGYNYHPISDINVARKLLKECHETKKVSYDIETTGLRHEPTTVIRTIAFCTGYPNKRYVHIVGDYKIIIDEELIDDSVCAFVQDKKERDYITNFLLRYILNEGSISKIGWNLKFDNAHIERVFGYKVKGKVLDGQLIKRLFNPGERGAGLKNTTIELLDESYHNYEDDVLKHLQGRKTKDSIGKMFQTVEATELCGYNAIDTEAALIITDNLYTKLRRFPSLENLYHKIVDPLSQVLTSVELQGMCVDKELLIKYINELGIEALLYEDLIRQHPKIKSYCSDMRRDSYRDFEETDGDKKKIALSEWEKSRQEIQNLRKYSYNKDVPYFIKQGIDSFLDSASKTTLKTWFAKTGGAIAKKIFGKDIEHHYEYIQHKLNGTPIKKAPLRKWLEIGLHESAEWSIYGDILTQYYSGDIMEKSFDEFYSSGVIGKSLTKSIHESYVSTSYDAACKKVSQIHARRLKLIKPLNLESPLQLKKLIFGSNGFNMDELSIGTKFEGAEKTDAGLLKRLPFEKTDFPEFVEYFLIIKGIGKATSTYLKRFYEDSVRHEDGTDRIHGSFGINSTTTGRLSSSSPNLQNIPRAGSKTGTAIKSCVIAPKGYKMMQIDFSQMELRMLALASFDKHMLNIYASGEDLHKFAAMSILGVDEDGWNKIDKSEKKKARTMAKAVNFGYMYGMGAATFVEYAETSYGLQFTKKEAEDLQTKFFTSFPSIVRYYTQMKQMIYEYIENYKSIPYVFNMFGRMRPLSVAGVQSFEDYKRLDQKAKNKALSSMGRNAINTVIQSSCADLMMLFLIQFNDRINEFNSMIKDAEAVKIINTVHDSIILYVKEECVNSIYVLTKCLIQNPTWMEDFGIPFDKDIIFEVDFEIGENWANLKEFEYKPVIA